MAVTIADLEVNIRDNGQSATLALNALINTLQKLASNIAPATKGLKETTKELKTVDKTANKAASGGLGKFFKSIVRIAGYRAIRSALKMITSGFREGVQNIALYSQAIGGVDASKANEVMSAYASMGAQIKNSLGAAIMPLLANLMPTIQKVANLFMDAAEAVAKFFATLNGQATYTAANRDYWVDYAKGLNKSNAAAKELKRTILGFDEINALQKQSGGGSGSSAINYADMFTEEVNDFLPLKQTFEDVLRIVKLIGAALVTWRIGSAVVDTISKLREMSKGQGVAIGIYLTVLGIATSLQGGYGFGLTGSTGSLIEGILGVVTTSIGGAFLGFSTVGGLPGLLIGLGVGFVIGAISFLAGWAAGAGAARYKETLASVLEGTGLTVDDVYGDTIKAHQNVALEIRESITATTGELDAKTVGKLEYARKLVEDIFTLNGIDNKAPSQIAELKTKVEAFNSLKLDGIQIEFNNVTGEVISCKEEIQGMIDKLEESLRLTALYNAAQKSAENLAEAEYQLTVTSQKRQAAQEAFIKTMHVGTLEEAIAMAELKNHVGAMGSAFSGLTSEEKEAYDTWKSYDDLVNQNKENIRDLQGKTEHFLKEASEAAKKAGKEIQNALTFDLKIKTTVLSNGDIHLSGTGGRITQYASGGLVPTGDLFWAGERAPELIMSAPGGSEVVNMAQFQDAMVSAVMMAGGNGGGDWTIVVQDESGAVRSRQVITAAERANRRDGRTIVPVGVQ